MLPRLLAATLVVAACLLTGCTPAASPQPSQPDPFGYPSTPDYCPPGLCQPGQCPPNCPPGCCPTPRHSDEVQGIEVGTASPHPVNSMAQNEVKGGTTQAAPDPSADEIKTGPCLPCQQQPLYRPARQPNLQPLAHVPLPDSATHEVKQGRFACERCKQPTVGRDWQEIWSDDGTSILAMCRRCYATATPAQREATFRGYLARHGVDPAKRPYVEAAVMQAVRGH